MNDATTRPQYPLPEGVHTVSLGFGDLNGIMRGKYIPASQWPRACAEGIAIIGAMFAMDVTCDVWDTPFAGFDNGYPDIHMFPSSAPMACPWDPGIAICLAVTETADHLPVPVDPRNALVRQVERARDLGLCSRVGTELEFYLLDEETMLPRQSGLQVYSMLRSAEMEPILGPIRNGLADIGIPVEQSNPEYAAGQVEVNLRYDEALTGADRVVLFRNTVKDIAARHGYLATFMAKPFIDRSGSGFHTHHSLWRDGVNVFADHGSMNSMGLAFLAGLQKRMAEMSVVSSATPNGYRRRQPGMFAPINNAWGYDNRTASLRVLEGSDSAVRVEKRDAAADSNPYYLLACELAAGLDGIEQGLVPKFDPERGDACKKDCYELLPRSMNEAVELARESDFLDGVMGAEAKAIYLQQAEREQAFVDKQVTAVEIERYRGNL
ncbi:glutamine synthetase family protein [Leekyejoonella antrihumi]|uniref:Glutamine synthetase n=1 Tax=Leekyejoonella antrihumi TaxID=1660198 RepID=A0A563DQK5_9MICO|nr:glutamine synthetase family protein [Leekyejoonella antrihumi]TWP32517.1 glutamine synthetase [Leekyejoonella antrihumi]